MLICIICPWLYVFITAGTSPHFRQGANLVTDLHSLLLLDQTINIHLNMISNNIQTARLAALPPPPPPSRG